MRTTILLLHQIPIHTHNLPQMHNPHCKHCGVKFNTRGVNRGPRHLVLILHQSPSVSETQHFMVLQFTQKGLVPPHSVEMLTPNYGKPIRSLLRHVLYSQLCFCKVLFVLNFICIKTKFDTNTKYLCKQEIIHKRI